jgi:hypothetical protein
MAQEKDSSSKATLTVRIFNGTQNGSSFEGDQVQVKLYQEGQFLYELDGRADSEGKAVFENILTNEYIVAVPSVKHQNMMFTGSALALKPVSNTFSASVMAFDVSDDTSKLSVGSHHFIMEPHPGYMRVTEYLQLRNLSDKAVTANIEDIKNSKVVEVKLPAGFKDLSCSSYFEQHALVVTEEGFYDKMAMPPGKHQAVFAYTVDITSETMDITRPITLPTEDFILFSQLPAGSVKGLGEAAGQMTMDKGTASEYYTLSDLKTGDKVQFQLSGLTVPESDKKLWVVLGIIFGVIILMAVFQSGSKKES